MRNITLTLASVTVLGVVSLTGSASAATITCSDTTPGNDSGDVTFGCVRGDRGVTVATVEEYISEEGDDEYWYNGYHTSVRDDLNELCVADRGGSSGQCYARVMKRHSGGSTSTTWEAFGSSLESGCADGDCSYEVKVVALECDCF
jgi:hypothetical protein